MLGTLNMKQIRIFYTLRQNNPFLKQDNTSQKPESTNDKN
jgi:hypothetical protein